MLNWVKTLQCMLLLLTRAIWNALKYRLLSWNTRKKFCPSKLKTKANRKKSSRRWLWAVSTNTTKKYAWLTKSLLKDPDQTVGKLVKAAGAEVLAFSRFQLGEGIEKKQEDFAAEVMSQIK